MTATGNLTTILTRTQECVVHDLTGAGKAGFNSVPTRQNKDVSGRAHSGAVPSAVPNTPPAPDSQTPSKPIRIDGKE